MVIITLPVRRECSVNGWASGKSRTYSLYARLTMSSSIVLRIYESVERYDIFPFFFFQRAYSLPARTHTPSSQNRINLRRCVRREPPPHPARLRKHRHGWTLHLEHPLETSKCTRSLVLLIVLLLGVGAVALYIALGKWCTLTIS